jgi:hypothetical protein
MSKQERDYLDTRGPVSGEWLDTRPVSGKLLDACERAAGLKCRNAGFRRLVSLGVTYSVHVHFWPLPQVRGRPARQAFEGLIKALAIAFEQAKGRRATISYNSVDERYAGGFWDLVETVLPEIAARTGSADIAPPTESARGRKISRTLAGFDAEPREEIRRALEAIDEIIQQQPENQYVRAVLKYMDKKAR